MTRDTQEYINSLINKPRIYFLDLNNWNLTKNQSEGDRQLKGEINDLKDFQNLKGINVSNNELNNLNFLDTLPNKDKLKGINLYGNQITEVDFAELFTKFPNLEKINLANNPLSAKNLSNLTNEQFGKLIEGIKNKTIKINSFKGTILADLFAYVSELVKSGNTNHTATSHYLKTLINDNDKQENSPIKSPEREKPSNNASLLIGGLIIFGLSLLAIGYWWGKKKSIIKKSN